MIASAASQPTVVERMTSHDIPKASRAAQASEKFAANVAIAEWDQEETSRLLQFCKENGTTAHGAICAAATRHLPASGANIIRMHCPIDLSRNAAKRNPGCGVFIGAGIAEIPAASRKFWKDARCTVDDLRTARSPEVVAGMLQRIAADIPPTAAKDSVAAFFASIRKAPQSFQIWASCRLPLNTGH